MRCARTSSGMIDVLFAMNTVSMAIVGTSEIKTRRRAFAIGASTPMRSKTISSSVKLLISNVNERFHSSKSKLLSKPSASNTPWWSNVLVYDQIARGQSGDGNCVSERFRLLHRYPRVHNRLHSLEEKSSNERTHISGEFLTNGDAGALIFEMRRKATLFFLLLHLNVLGPARHLRIPVSQQYMRCEWMGRKQVEGTITKRTLKRDHLTSALDNCQ